MTDIYDSASFTSGWETAHVDMSKGVQPTEETYATYPGGIIVCGIGGLTCSCNIDRIEGEVDIFEYVDGVNLAVNEAENGVLV